MVRARAMIGNAGHSIHAAIETCGKKMEHRVDYGEETTLSNSILLEWTSFDQSQSQPQNHEDENENKYGDRYESIELGEYARNYDQARSPAFKGFTVINKAGAVSSLRSSLLSQSPLKRVETPVIHAR